MNGDEVRNFNYELIEEMREKMRNHEQITDNERRYLAELLKIEASNKDSDTQAYKAGLDFDARMKEAKMDLYKTLIDNGVKVATVAIVILIVVALAKHDETGSFDKTALSPALKLIRL